MQRQTKTEKLIALAMTLAIGVAANTGCVSMQHDLARHCCLFDKFKESHKSYYHCEHCGQIVANENTKCCPHCQYVKPFYGYEPTCWKQFPAGWGCPTGPASSHPEMIEYNGEVISMETEISNVETPTPTNPAAQTVANPETKNTVTPKENLANKPSGDTNSVSTKREKLDVRSPSDKPMPLNDPLDLKATPQEKAVAPAIQQPDQTKATPVSTRGGVSIVQQRSVPQPAGQVTSISPAEGMLDSPREVSVEVLPAPVQLNASIQKPSDNSREVESPSKTQSPVDTTVAPEKMPAVVTDSRPRVAKIPVPQPIVVTSRTPAPKVAKESVTNLPAISENVKPISRVPVPQILEFEPVNRMPAPQPQTLTFETKKSDEPPTKPEQPIAENRRTSFETIAPPPVRRIPLTQEELTQPKIVKPQARVLVEPAASKPEYHPTPAKRIELSATR